MAELSIMVDESGEWGKESEYYLITLVLHNQSKPLSSHIKKYEHYLQDGNLPNIPFHAGPLLNGHDSYRGLDLAQRKKLLFAFFTLSRNLPFSYVTFSHRKNEFDDDKDKFKAQLRKDLADFLLSNLSFFQSYECIKNYYDNGQSIVKEALTSSIAYSLSKEAVIYRDGSPLIYRLEQVADFLCTLELTALKYDAKQETSTDRKFFRNRHYFTKNYLKVLRKKHF